MAEAVAKRMRELPPHAPHVGVVEEPGTPPAAADAVGDEIAAVDNLKLRPLTTAKAARSRDLMTMQTFPAPFLGLAAGGVSVERVHLFQREGQVRPGHPVSGRLGVKRLTPRRPNLRPGAA